MPLDATPMPHGHAPARGARSRAPLWRGAAGAISLAAWSLAGVVWAALALLPVALQRGPRGRAGTALPVAEPRRLVPDLPPAETVPAARAAGEAFPG